MPIGGRAPHGGLIRGHKAVEMSTDHNFVQVGKWASNLIPGLDFCMENCLKLLSSKLHFHVPFSSHLVKFSVGSWMS